MSTSSPLTFVHLSDLHLVPPGQLAHGIDSLHLVQTVLTRSRRLNVRPAFIVVSGDLSEDGSAASYDVLNEIVRGLEAESIPVLLALGNHDDRDAFRRTVLGESAANGQAPYHHARTLDGIRVVVLDSVIPGETAGVLGEAQLAWLETELTESSPSGALIVVHHPCRLAATDNHFPEFVLGDATTLEAIVARSPSRVLGVLAGHSHQANTAPFAGSIHTTAPAVLCQLDFFADEKYVPIAGSGFNLCRIQDGQLIVHPVLIGSD